MTRRGGSSVVKTSALEVEDLCKSYGDVRAVDGISLQVHSGEVFGLLGPNGAGKTTTIEIIEGYKVADSGRVTVLGMDARQDRRALREYTGIMLQETALYPDLKVGELLRLFGSYYRRATDADELLEMIRLGTKRAAFVRDLSGGQRQRLSFILALINDPQVIFLDEPTAGLDPQSRRVIWEWIGRGRQQGKTVFLTTHYIEEAEALCDRVAIIDQGHIIALGSPRQLVSRSEMEQRIEFEIDGSLDIASLASLPEVTKITEDGQGRFVLYVREAEATLGSLLALGAGNGYRLRGLRVEGATLEDVFIQLTGRRIRA